MTGSETVTRELPLHERQHCQHHVEPFVVAGCSPEPYQRNATPKLRVLFRDVLVAAPRVTSHHFSLPSDPLQRETDSPGLQGSKPHPLTTARTAVLHIKDESACLPTQILVIHVPNKQRLGCKRIRLHVHVCSCHLKPNDQNSHRCPTLCFLSQCTRGTAVVARLTILVEEKNERPPWLNCQGQELPCFVTEDHSIPFCQQPTGPESG